MRKYIELIKSPEYWHEKFQNELYRQLKDFMDKTGKSQNDIAKDLKVSKSYISQILNGKFNFTLKKLIDLSLYMGKIPELNFTIPEKYLLKSSEATIGSYESTTINTCSVSIDTSSIKTGYIEPIMNCKNILLPSYVFSFNSDKQRNYSNIN